jgi:hypothetical protein
MPQGRSRWNRCVCLGVATLVALSLASPLLAETKPVVDIQDAELAAACAKLNDPKMLELMDGLLLRLAVQCGRTDLLGQIRQEENEPGLNSPLGTDARVNNVTGESGSRTQNETSLAYNATTGTLCSSFNDAYGGVVLGTDYTGFSRSIDGGASWTDRGAVHPTTGTGFGDPAIIWRKSDGKFYEATLHSSGLGFWRSDDDCQTLTYVGLAHSGANDDKELLSVDNNPASPYYGRIYLMWTDFTVGNGQIKSIYTDNGGGTWSSPLLIGSVGAPQGVWPVVAPDGKVYAAWVDRASSTVITLYVVKSTDGGVTFNPTTSPGTNLVAPQQAASTSSCGRPALNGNLRYLPSPQIAVGPDGVVHIVYSHDPNAQNTGDVIDVYYKRSVDGGANWSTEVRLNDDATTNDQFFPSISVGATNIVTTGWYDRREDGSNLRINYYTRTSFDGGQNWQANAKVSDVDSPMVLDSGLATCYHGDYDTQVPTPSAAVIQWGDDRDNSGGSNNADVYVDTIPLSVDFLVLPTPLGQAICAGNDAVYSVSVPSFQSFVSPVTLSATGNPAPTTTGFGTNPITPGNSTNLTIGSTGAAAAGSYVINVQGSAAGPINHSQNVGLDVYVGTPGTSTLTAPADTAINVVVRPTFTWSAAAGVQSYLLEVDNDSGFGSPEISTTVAGTSFTPGADLASNMVFYWRVTANNPCGAGSSSSVFSFTTVALPGDCSTGLTQNLFYAYGFESGAGGWTSSGTGNTWASSAAQTHSGAASWLAIDPASVTDQRLVSPTFAVPAGTGISLIYWSRQTIEHNGTTGCYDGGILEISNNGGGTWTQATSSLLTDLYDGPVSTCCSNPLATLQAWCGDPADWTRSVVSLDSYAGQNVQFRFRLGTDSSVSREGWYLDDVTLQQCVSGLFQDGFETGNFSRWSGTGN